MVNETGGTFFDGIGYNYEMLNERTRSNNKMTIDTHFRKKPKRLPSYIKLERAIEDDNSEDSTSTADSSESGAGSSCSIKSCRLTKMPKKIVKNCLRKVARSVCGGVDGDDECHVERREQQSQNHETSQNHEHSNSVSVINNTGVEANTTEEEDKTSTSTAQ